MRKLIFGSLLTLLFVVLTCGQTPPASLNFQAQWSDGSHCLCSLTILKKGVNGAPDEMVFSATSPDGHITAKISFDPTQTYSADVFSHDLNVDLYTFMFTSGFLTPIPLAKLNFNLKFTKPGISPASLAPGSSISVGI